MTALTREKKLRYRATFAKLIRLAVQMSPRQVSLQ